MPLAALPPQWACHRPRRVHSTRRDFLLAPWGVVRSAHLGVRMVGHCSQHRSHRLLLVSPPQTALPSPPRGSAFNIHVNRQGLSVQVTTKEMGTLESDAWLLWLLWLFLTRMRVCVCTAPPPCYSNKLIKQSCKPGDGPAQDPANYPTPVLI